MTPTKKFSDAISSPFISQNGMLTPIQRCMNHGSNEWEHCAGRKFCMQNHYALVWLHDQWQCLFNLMITFGLFATNHFVKCLLGNCIRSLSISLLRKKVVGTYFYDDNLGLLIIISGGIEIPVGHVVCPFQVGMATNNRINQVSIYTWERMTMQYSKNLIKQQYSLFKMHFKCNILNYMKYEIFHQLRCSRCFMGDLGISNEHSTKASAD